MSSNSTRGRISSTFIKTWWKSKVRLNLGSRPPKDNSIIERSRSDACVSRRPSKERKDSRKETRQASMRAEITSTTMSKETFQSTIFDAEDESENKSDASERNNMSIKKVPPMLRDNKDLQNYFEPKQVSIGPYHHGKEKLIMGEKLKLKLTKKFINGKRQQMKEVYEKIVKDMKELKKLYEREPTNNFDDEQLARMLFVDGCALLHYIDCYMNDKLKDFKIFAHHTALVNRDMFLLENQLPFEILDRLMKAKSEPDKGMVMIEKFIERYIKTRREQKLQKQQEESEMPPHLLELLRRRLRGKPGNQEGWQQARIESLCLGRCIKNNNNKNDDYDWHKLRNVTELKALGIRLKPSETNCLDDVSFQSHFIYGTLKIPRIVVNDSMRPLFLNLIAYEMSPGVNAGMDVTSYMCFLDLLIDHPDDVKQLRSAHILYNFLGSDDEVANIFNEIGRDLGRKFDKYNDVKTKIQKHYKDRGMYSRMAQLIHDHFSSPIAFFAFVVGFLLLILSVVQTIFAIRGPLSGDCDVLCKSLKKQYAT